MNDSHPQQEPRILTVTRNIPARLPVWVRRYRGSLLFVMLPTALAAVYYFLIAADLYASEAKFVVRSPSHMQTTGLAGLLQQTTGINRAQDDVFSVHDFVMSRDAVTALEKKVDLRAIFNRPEADFLAAYPNILFRKTSEDFFRYYTNRVDVSYDSTTGISMLTVKAFRAEDAKLVGNLLLSESEILVNRLNQRAHDNAVRDAETDVKLVEDRIAQAQQNMLDYRNREVMLDPAKTSGAIFETITKMQGELTAARTRLAELDSGSPGSPLRSGLETHIAELERQIESQRIRLAGSSGSMAPKISEYEQLLLRQDFAAKELASAFASLESAREEARRQQIYLDRVVEASLPDKALYPERIKSVLILFFSCLIAYSIAKLLIAGVREHEQD